MAATNELLDLRTHNIGAASAESQEHAPAPDRAPTAKAACQGAGRNEPAIIGLQRAMDELVKAQDHLNTAGDYAKDDLAKVIAGIIQKVRGLQREVSNTIHTAGFGK